MFKAKQKLMGKIIFTMDGVTFLDASVMGMVQGHCHNAFTDAVFPIITYLGEYGALWIALSLGLLLFKKYRRWGALMLCAMAGGFLMGEVLIKNLMCRPRPFQQFPAQGILLIPPPTGYSFPSGHSCSSFAAATVLFSFSKKWGGCAFLLAGLIAFSRVFLFVHWPTDVLAGSALGIIFGLLAIFLYRRQVLPRIKKAVPK